MYYLTSNEWVHEILLKRWQKHVFYNQRWWCLDKYNAIWDKIKETLNIKFHSLPVYDEKYLKAKVREFNGVIKTNFLGNGVPEENVHYTYVASITIDSVVRIKKRIIHMFI